MQEASRAPRAARTARLFDRATASGWRRRGLTCSRSRARCRPRSSAPAAGWWGRRAPRRE
eukprot:446589-Prymnesium_polylepis.1